MSTALLRASLALQSRCLRNSFSISSLPLLTEYLSMRISTYVKTVIRAYLLTECIKRFKVVVELLIYNDLIWIVTGFYV